MKVINTILLGLLVTTVLVGGVATISIISTYNGAIRSEKEIEAQYKQNQNSRSQLVNSIAEVSQVPAMYRNDLREVISAAMVGRYGSNGSKAVFQWFKEQQIDIPAKMYTKIQHLIEADRAKFAHEQQLLIDKKRLYKVKLETFPSNIILSTFGFPKIDLSKYNIVVSTDNAKVFNSGVEQPIKLR